LRWRLGSFALLTGLPVQTVPSVRIPLVCTENLIRID
jgi:hypothetical protein